MVFFHSSNCSSHRPTVPAIVQLFQPSSNCSSHRPTVPAIVQLFQPSSNFSSHRPTVPAIVQLFQPFPFHYILLFFKGMMLMEVIQKMFRKTFRYTMIHASISHSYSDLLTNTDYFNNVNRDILFPNLHLTFPFCVYLVCSFCLSSPNPYPIPESWSSPGPPIKYICFEGYAGWWYLRCQTNWP